MILPLYSGLAGPHLESGVLCPALGHPYTDTLDKVQHRPTNEQGSAAQITEGKADSAGNIQPTEEKIQGQSHQWAQIPEKHMLKYRVRLSSVVHCNRTRGDGAWAETQVSSEGKTFFKTVKGRWSMETVELKPDAWFQQVMAQIHIVSLAGGVRRDR